MTVGALGFRLAEPNIIQEEESLEQEVETAKADENEDQTNSTPSRGEGEETMDADHGNKSQYRGGEKTTRWKRTRITTTNSTVTLNENEPF